MPRLGWMMSPTHYHSRSHPPALRCSAKTSEDEVQTRQKRCLPCGLSTYCVQPLLLGRSQRKEGLWPCHSLRSDEDSQNGGGWERRTTANSSAGRHQGAQPSSCARRLEGSQHMVCISYIICKEPQPFCNISPCSQSIWTFVSVSADPISALDIQKVK